MICLNPGVPAINTTHLFWNCFGDSKTQELAYDFTVKNNLAAEIIEFLIYNSFDEIDLSPFIHGPKLLPVGPLLTHHHSAHPAGHFWPVDSTCMDWLDQQQARSVIYVAFGSLTVLSQHQFEELALGLELTRRPFLWAVRPDLTASSTDACNRAFRDIASTRGKMVRWSPQQKVLAHPSVACFISHCGWNSTMEGVRNGIPFLCWPYFADQFLNESYICDVWRVGLRLTLDERGMISRQQITAKLEELLGNPELTFRALSLKEMITKRISKGGSSYENLGTFAEAMKETRLGSRDPTP
ncbi:uncharacterized protein A4U43_C08F16490 [Asparagus officinalis]|nr:uncharacterized protein A4U43_C08F16490 [Asparagus officinalis]